MTRARSARLLNRHHLELLAAEAPGEVRARVEAAVAQPSAMPLFLLSVQRGGGEGGGASAAQRQALDALAWLERRGV